MKKFVALSILISLCSSEIHGMPEAKRHLSSRHAGINRANSSALKALFVGSLLLGSSAIQGAVLQNPGIIQKVNGDMVPANNGATKLEILNGDELSAELRKNNGKNVLVPLPSDDSVFPQPEQVYNSVDLLLLTACAEGASKTAEKLLQSGANVNAIDSDNYTCLDHAIRLSNNHLALEILKRRPNQLTLDRALLNASKNIKIITQVSMELLNQGANPNARGTYNWTPLMHASQLANKELCELLVTNKAEVNAVNYKGRAALHYASEQGHDGICQFLIDNKAKVDMCDSWGVTPLGLATYQKFTSTQKLLTSHGASLSLMDYGYLSSNRMLNIAGII